MTNGRHSFREGMGASGAPSRLSDWLGVDPTK
jgi:hypothetical protein